MEITAPKPEEIRAAILVASDNFNDAAQVGKLLAKEFEDVFLSTNPELAVKDFESRTPDMLVLAFNSLEKTKRYYLGLYRLSSSIHLLSHRTIILCKKEEVSRAYQACKKNYFDDYILFWPMSSDNLRLLMSVHHALRDLAAMRSDQPTSAQFAAQARKLTELEAFMDQQMALGEQRIEQANRAISQAQQDVGEVLDGFSQKITQGELPDALSARNVASLEREIKRLKQEVIGKRLVTVAQSVQPIKQWTDEFKKDCAPMLESARTLTTMANRVRLTILIVDDDDFQRMILSELLGADNYRLVFAGGGIEALNILRITQPDLILMDIKMPDMDGIETTRRIKTIAQFATVPVIMVTGNRERVAVLDSMKVGIANFVVKPFDRDSLLAKVADALHP
ncbi:MAG: response regulator [Methylococcaceae bacterium]|nr:MAG: response regulator [Methylococcaceae bacterium]